MPRIFISYSRVDRPLVVELATRLRRIYGLDQIWFDEGIHGGDLWWQEILEQIAHCDIFIYMLSRDSIESETCLAELTEARRLRKFVLPVLARARTPIPPDLSVIQYVDMSLGITVDNITDLEAAINTLSSDIPSMPPKPLVPDPASLPAESAPKENYGAHASYQKLWTGVGLAAILVVIAAIAGLIANLDPSPNTSFTFTPTSRVQSAGAATETRAITPTRTRIPTREPTHAPTHTPTPDADRLTDLARRGVEHNAGWTPLSQSFNGVEMVLVPSGCFMMGSSPDQINFILQQESGFDAGNFEQETPEHRVCFDSPFWIDRYEVTNEQISRFGGVVARRDRPAEAELPISAVSWIEARDFCALREMRLPTEAEWEYAARGPDSLILPWGDDVSYSKAIWETRGPANVGSRPLGMSWVGAYDFSGNVWEWVNTIHHNSETFSYPYVPDDGREAIAVEGAFRIIRGGSWKNGWVAGRTASRGWVGQYETPDEVGFRCARDG